MENIWVLIMKNTKILVLLFLEGEDEIIKKSDIIVQLGLPDKEKLSLLKENQTLIDH